MPFVKPSPIQSDVNTTSHDQSSQSESSKSSQSEMMGLDIDQSESAIVSRLHLSGQQRKVKEGFEQKKRDEAKKQALLEKKRQKEVTLNILMNYSIWFDTMSLSWLIVHIKGFTG